MTQSNIIGVQFEEVGKIYYFDASLYPDLEVGDPIVVRTSRGLQLAKIIQVKIDEQDLDLSSFKSVERPASPKDLLQRKALAIEEEESKEKIREYLNENDLSGVKVVSAEYSLDGNRLFLLINSESSVTYDIKKLHQEIQKMFQDVHLEIRQIGPRDAAKLIRGMGACGLETRCCSKFLTEFNSISIRMAKTQDISLTPSEITGMCGRLRCCLMYEYDQYVEAIKTLPKRKRKVQTPMGEGKVIQILPLQQAVIVDLPEIGPRQFTKEELDQAEREARGEKIEPRSDEDSGFGTGGNGSNDNNKESTKPSGSENNKSTSHRRPGWRSRRSKEK